MDQPLTSRLRKEELDLIRWIGGHLSRILQGHYEEVPTTNRRDELGILANMVGRVARELRLGQERDERDRAALETQIRQLDAARKEQQRLLEAIRELSSPVLDIHRGVVLLPLIGTLDAARMRHATQTLLQRIVAAQARVVIIDMAGVPTFDAEVGQLLYQASRSIALLGSRTILCGVSPAVAKTAIELGVDPKGVLVCGSLADALAKARNLLRDNGVRG